MECHRRTRPILGPNLYLIFPVIVMVISAMFIFYFCPKLQDKHCREHYDYKSDNLQYNTLARWVDGTNDSSTKRLMFQALFFFIISYRLRALKTLYFYFCKFIKKYKNKLKQFLQRILQEIMKKK